MWIAFDQSGKRESGLAKVRRYRLQNDVGPRRELLRVVPAAVSLLTIEMAERPRYRLRDVHLHGAQPKRALPP